MFDRFFNDLRHHRFGKAALKFTAFSAIIAAPVLGVFKDDLKEIVTDIKQDYIAHVAQKEAEEQRRNNLRYAQEQYERARYAQEYERVRNAQEQYKESRRNRRYENPRVVETDFNIGWHLGNIYLENSRHSTRYPYRYPYVYPVISTHSTISYHNDGIGVVLGSYSHQ